MCASLSRSSLLVREAFRSDIVRRRTQYSLKQEGLRCQTARDERPHHQPIAIRLCRLRMVLMDSLMHWKHRNSGKEYPRMAFLEQEQHIQSSEGAGRSNVIFCEAKPEEMKLKKKRL